MKDRDILYNFCSICFYKMLTCKKILPKMCENFLNSRYVFFRAIASADVLHFRRIRKVCVTSAHVALSSLKILRFYLKALLRKMLDNVTLWKSLNRGNLETGSDVIKIKNYISGLIDVPSVLKVSWKSSEPFPRNRVHKIGKKKKE